MCSPSVVFANEAQRVPTWLSFLLYLEIKAQTIARGGLISGAQFDLDRFSVRRCDCDITGESAHAIYIYRKLSTCAAYLKPSNCQAHNEPVADHVPVLGSYNSALLRTDILLDVPVIPPVTRTLPSWSSVAV